MISKPSPRGPTCPNSSLTFDSSQSLPPVESDRISDGFLLFQAGHLALQMPLTPREAFESHAMELAMNFEVFKTESELNSRVSELRQKGVVTIISNFNGSAWVLKWSE